MNIDDIFQKGVTPLSGENAGKRFRVVTIHDAGVTVRDWESGQYGQDMKHGDYKIWQEPKTLFEDSTIKPTWGNLKKAAEKAGISDDMEFAVRFSEFFDCRYKQASFEIKELYKKGGEKIKCILVQ